MTVEECGIKIIAGIGDNAANMQKVCTTSHLCNADILFPRQALKAVSDEQPLVPLGCMAHQLNLFIKDLIEVFQLQMDQCNNTFLYFKNRHEPHRAYAEAARLMGGSNLKGYCDTRWGSQVDSLLAMSTNKRCVLQAAVQLRARDYPMHNAELAWIWRDDWWTTIKNMHSLLAPLNVAITMIQADRFTLSQGLSSAMHHSIASFPLHLRSSTGAPTVQGPSGLCQSVCSRRHAVQGRVLR